MEDYVVSVASQSGFDVIGHRLVMSGTCAGCRYQAAR
jgi:hypothetical protein